MALAMKQASGNTVENLWLVMLFSLPRVEASARVDVWRRLKKSGALLLPSGGHVLPGSPDNRERFEWLAEAIRNNGGEVSVLRVSAIDDLPFEKIKRLFVAARDADYFLLIEDARLFARDADAREAGLVRLRRRLQEISDIDYFGGKVKQRAESAIHLLAETFRVQSPAVRGSVVNKQKITNRVWVTRPRPGIDRAASAWLISNFIDRKARFKFAKEAASVHNSIPFDMYRAGGFGHVGDHCTFETLLGEFKLRQKSLQVLAEMIHDADLKDEKFGRTEAVTVDRILKGWSSTGVSDEELLRKGMDLIDGLYHSIA